MPYSTRSEGPHPSDGVRPTEAGAPPVTGYRLDQPTIISDNRPGYVRFSMLEGTEVATLTASDFRAAMSECDALRAEKEDVLERLDSMTIARDAALESVRRTEAENERLTLCDHDHVVEIERLRAALERLVDIGPSATLREWRDAQAAGAVVLGKSNYH